MEVPNLEAVHIVFIYLSLFILAVNKLITDKIQYYLRKWLNILAFEYMPSTNNIMLFNLMVYFFKVMLRKVLWNNPMLNTKK